MGTSVIPSFHRTLTSVSVLRVNVTLYHRFTSLYIFDLKLPLPFLKSQQLFSNFLLPKQLVSILSFFFAQVLSLLLESNWDAWLQTPRSPIMWLNLYTRNREEGVAGEGWKTNYLLICTPSSVSWSKLSTLFIHCPYSMHTALYWVFRQHPSCTSWRAEPKSLLLLWLMILLLP